MGKKRKTFSEFLDELVEGCEANVQEYEAFHSTHLADIRRMDPTDVFLYGTANGKLDMALYLTFFRKKSPSFRWGMNCGHLTNLL